MELGNSELSRLKSSQFLESLSIEIMGGEGEKYDFMTFCTWLAKDVYRHGGTL